MNETNTVEAFPLYWPVGYKRTQLRISSRFNITMDKAQVFLRKEIDRIGGTGLIVSTNIPIRKDGLLYADWMSKKIEDPGVAIYFKYKAKDVSMCCDQYLKIWENVYALGKGVEALRGMERWGVSEFLERAFTGFTAIAEKILKPEWWEILSVQPSANKEQVRQAYIKKAKILHPDVGGDTETFKIIVDAYMQGLNQ